MFTGHLHDVVDVLVLGRISDDLGATRQLVGASLALDDALHLTEGFFQEGETLILPKGHCLTTIVRRCDKFEGDLDVGIARVDLGSGGDQSLLECVDTLISEAIHLEISTKLHGCGRHLFRDAIVKDLLLLGSDPNLLEDCLLITHDQSECIEGMTVFVIQVPSKLLIQLLEGAFGCSTLLTLVIILFFWIVYLDNHLLQDVVHHLGLLEVHLSRRGISSEYLLLRQIDVPLLSVDTDDHHGLLLADLHVLVDELYALLCDLCGQQVALHVLVLEKLGVGTVLVNLGDLCL